MTLPPGSLREALIDVAAVESNARHIRRVTNTPMIAVVKADGYGHGALRAARAALAGGAAIIGVSDVDEALALRAERVTAPMLAWLHGPGADFRCAVAEHISIGISSMGELQAAASAGSVERPAIVHLKAETGLSRNGIAPADWAAVFSAAAAYEREGVIRVEGAFSHLSNTSKDADRAALAVFTDALASMRDAGLRPALRHIAATNAALALPEARLDAVRIGIGLYGLSPFDGRTSADLGLRPAMTLQAAVANVRRVPAGTGVSYGYIYRTDRETTLALVPAGYADGVPRQASNRASVWLNGKQYRVSGRIAMDQFVVDVGDDPVAVGDTAVLFGDPTTGVPSADEWAVAADTINYEIVTRVGARAQRREVSS